MAKKKEYEVAKADDCLKLTMAEGALEFDLKERSKGSEEQLAIRVRKEGTRRFRKLFDYDCYDATGDAEWVVGDANLDQKVLDSFSELVGLEKPDELLEILCSQAASHRTSNLLSIALEYVR